MLWVVIVFVVGIPASTYAVQARMERRAQRRRLEYIRKRLKQKEFDQTDS